MSRRAKPFFHRGSWWTNAGGQRTRLAKGRQNRKQAEDALIDLLKALKDRPTPTEPATPAGADLTVTDLSDRFLAWVELHRSKDTHDDYRDWLARWKRFHGTRPAKDIKSLDLEDWKSTLASTGVSNWTINHAIVAVKVCWSWAVKYDLLSLNPLAKVQKLDTDGRSRVFTADEFRSLLRGADVVFRRILLFLRLTGLRPGELCRLSWADVDLANGVAVLRRHKTYRKTRRPRIVHLPLPAKHLLRFLARSGTEGPVFRGRGGRPFTVNGLRCRMKRLRERVGIGPDQNGENIVLYTTRHTFGSRAAAAGVTDRRLADLMGHTDPKMTQKYIHLANPDLQRAVSEATKAYLA
jgi:integrase